MPQDFVERRFGSRNLTSGNQDVCETIKCGDMKLRVLPGCLHSGFGSSLRVVKVSLDQEDVRAVNPRADSRPKIPGLLGIRCRQLNLLGSCVEVSAQHCHRATVESKLRLKLGMMRVIQQTSSNEPMTLGLEQVTLECFDPRGA